MSKIMDETAYNEIEEKRRINKIAVEKLSQYIKDNNIDILHINTTYSYVGALAALQENIPFVWHLREFLEEDQSNTLWDREKGNALINKADCVIAISDSIYKKYENILSKGKLVRIHNGIDADRFYKPFKNIFQEDEIKLIMVGGFEYYKGQPEFADACIKVLKRGYNVKVIFVGLGTQKVRDEVRAKFEKENLLDKVEFAGYKYDVENDYEKADISFTCAKSEAFGRTTVEAMLSGNLLIGVNTAGTKELINNNKTGLLYQQGNSDDLAEKIIYAIEHPKISQQIAKNGRRYMFENMTAEKNADNIYKLYNEILHIPYDNF
jgi:glycosyltransferase involved in cell wall biosynthesis